MENKFKHLDYIQSVISRMAANSFYLKGWNITIAAALIVLSNKDYDWKIFGCGLLFTCVFWGLDAYYLREERLFRKLYADVSTIQDDSKINFSMDTKNYEDEETCIFSVLFSKTVLPLYSVIALTFLVLILN